MNIKEKVQKILIKDEKAEKEGHLEKYLEKEYDVKIIKKYGAFILIYKDKILDYFYTIQDAKTFLEGKPDFKAVMIANGCPAERFEEKIVEEPAKEEVKEITDEEADNLLKGNPLPIRREEEKEISE